MSNVNKNLSIPIDTPLIDSLSLKIKMEHCTVLNKRLTSEVVYFYESINDFDDLIYPPKPLEIKQRGITVRFSLCQIPDFNKETKKSVKVDYVNFTLSAKLLKEDYFQGINKNNLKKLYDAFIAFGVVDLDYQHFKEARVSDIDICINRYIPDEDFREFATGLLYQADERAKHMRFFNEENELGLVYNKREWAVPSLPFIKMYQKELELINRSPEFYATYISDYATILPELVRVEATIKNWKHKKRLERKNILPPFSTLEELLEIPKTNLFEFICFSVGSYVQRKYKSKSPKLSPMDFLLYKFIEDNYSKGLEFMLGYADLFEGTSPATEKVAKTRIRNKIKELFWTVDKEQTLPEIQKIHSEHVNKFRQFLKIPSLQKPKKNEL